MARKKAVSFANVITCEDLIHILNGTNNWYLLIQMSSRLFQKDILALKNYIIRLHFETVQTNSFNSVI